MNNDLLGKLRDGQALSVKETLRLTLTLSIPAIMAQVSTVLMQYIDASMVGQLGENGSGAIGLVSSSTWLLGGLVQAVSIGFTVQIAHAIGAKENRLARDIVKQGLLVSMMISGLLGLCGLVVARRLPGWLGGSPEILTDAYHYFLIFALSLPFVQLTSLSGGMLQCSGNMKVPGFLNVVMCVLDVLFNALFIFPSGVRHIAGLTFSLPGLGLGVKGAALGTALSEVVISLVLTYYLLMRSDALRLRRHEGFHLSMETIGKAVRLGLPVACEQTIMCLAYITSTKIVAPLGTIALASHSLSITAESLCYMPGYGIGAAATTIIGQSVGARRYDLTQRLAWMTTIVGMVFMGLTGSLMYIFAPVMIGILSPVTAIRQLSTRVLRIEAFAEPLYGASIVATGALRGCGDTLLPSVMNFVSMWLVRLPLSAFLAGKIGLQGVWIAMCIELWVRGLLFMVRLKQQPWLHKGG